MATWWGSNMEDELQAENFKATRGSSILTLGTILIGQEGLEVFTLIFLHKD